MREIRRHRAEDSLVETVIIAEIDVVAAEAAIVLDYYSPVEKSVYMHFRHKLGRV